MDSDTPDLLGTGMQLQRLWLPLFPLWPFAWKAIRERWKHINNLSRKHSYSSRLSSICKYDS